MREQHIKTSGGCVISLACVLSLASAFCSYGASLAVPKTRPRAAEEARISNSEEKVPETPRATVDVRTQERFIWSLRPQGEASIPLPSSPEVLRQLSGLPQGSVP